MSQQSLTVLLSQVLDFGCARPLNSDGGVEDGVGRPVGPVGDVGYGRDPCCLVAGWVGLGGWFIWYLVQWFSGSEAVSLLSRFVLLAKIDVL